MLNEPQVRRRTPEDRLAVLDVVRAAFGGDEEVRLVERVWAAPEYLPELDLVAEIDEKVVGHVLHSTGYVEGRPVVALAPLAVLPEHQGKGVGTALMEEALRRADDGRHPLIVLLGHPSFYVRFGFGPARRLGIETDMQLIPGPDPFLARRLSAYDPSYRGMFRYCWDTR